MATRSWLQGVATGLLLAAAGLAADRSTTLSVQVRPEAALRAAGFDAFDLKIRLAPGAEARLWMADACTASAPDGYLVSRSGTFQIAVAGVPGQGANVCLSSSDGQLLLSWPVTRPVSP
jgi:hypothetical protein